MTHEEATNLLQYIANYTRSMHHRLEKGQCDTGSLLSFVDSLLSMVKDVPVQEDEDDDDEYDDDEYDDDTEEDDD